MTRDLLQERKTFASERLDELRRRIASIKHLSQQQNLSIYVTGSYGV